MLVPPRSELISLKPIGTGTPMAEGLLSYVIRLAAAHVVLELDLLIRVLRWTRGNSPTLELLRVRSNAKRALMLLIQKTQQASLRYHTLFPLVPLLGRCIRLRPTRAWCPECLADMKRRGTILYDPLVWQIATVSCCVIHKRALDSKCPVCRSRLKMGRRFFRSGYCSECGGWLGTRTPGESSRCTEAEV